MSIGLICGYIVLSSLLNNVNKDVEVASCFSSIEIRLLVVKLLFGLVLQKVSHTFSYVFTNTLQIMRRIYILYIMVP